VILSFKVKSVDSPSAAERSGLREGDCLLRVNDDDLLGRKVFENRVKFT
jgi:S1-C subfamily serine protease